MKQYHKIIFKSFLASLLLWGCSERLDDPVAEPMDESPTVFYAFIESGEATRAVLGDDDGTGARSVTWSLGDKINIGKAVYETQADPSGALIQGYFGTGFYGAGAVKEEGVYKAYYPSTLRASDGSTSLPQTQTLVYEEGKVRIDHLPMYAQHNSSSLAFGNMCSVLEICLTGEGSVGYIDVESLSGQRLWGPFSITNFDWNSAYPYNIRSFTYSMTGTPSANYSKVTLDCTGVPGGGVQLDAEQPTSFYVAIPVGTYGAGDLRIKVWNTYDVAVGNFTSKAQLVTERNKLYKMSKNLDNSNSAPPTINGLLIAPGDLYEDASGTLRIAETWDEFIPDNAPEKTYFSWKYLWENVLTTGRSGNAYNESSASTGTVDLPLRGKTYTWRLPYIHEWLNYIGKTTTRPGSTVNGESGYQFALIRLEYSDRYPKSDDAAGGTTTPLGLLIFPDNYRMTPSFTLPYRNSYRPADVNHGITYDQLTEYIEAGCVFLPGAGCVWSYPANPKGGIFNPFFGDRGNYHSANSLNLYIRESDGEGDANGPTGLIWPKINYYLSTRLIRVP